MTEMSELDREVEEFSASLPGYNLTVSPATEHQIFDDKPSLDEIIFLVVGGKKYETCWRALLRFPNTKLGSFQQKSFPCSTLTNFEVGWLRLQVPVMKCLKLLTDLIRC